MLVRMHLKQLNKFHILNIIFVLLFAIYIKKKMENTHYETSIISPVINNTILNGKTYIYKRKKK